MHSTEITPTSTDFAHAVIAGLSARQKVIQARYLYDETGSQLFEDITRLPEYYPTRAETSLLRQHGAEIADVTRHSEVVVELGSGSSTKTPLLLQWVRPDIYIPIDISGEFLFESAQALARAFPDIEILPVVADFTLPMKLPQKSKGKSKLGFFPGSTIGNLTPGKAIDLLRRIRTTLGEDAGLVIGFDMCRDENKLIAAYNDSAGVTAAFNLNLIAHVNRELGGTIPLDAFVHRAYWNAPLSRIEMHLVAVRDVAFRVVGREFSMRHGDTIHTENSYKYLPSDVHMLAQASGWQPLRTWQDHATGFSVQAWLARKDNIEP